MPLYAELPPPRDWQVFEDLCRDLFAAEWEDPETKKHGRSGQADQGVDVFGLRDGQWVGVQCKRRQKWPEKKLTEGEIRAEVEASRKFSSPLESLVIATTAEDSTHFDALARQLTDEVGFRVAIYGWQELCRRIQTHPKVYAVWHQNLLPHPAGPIPIHLPFLPLGDLLKGRQPELEALAAGLAPGSGRGAFAVIQQRTEAVHGLGGVGKTALAVEHAWNWQKFYSAVLFIRAESPELLRASLAELGPKVGLERIEEEAAATEAVLTWLGDHSGWLVILDNVDDEKAARAVTELLPQLTTGRVLITSRLSNWSARVTEFPLSELTTEEAVAFLLARAEKRLPTSQEAIQSAALAERLGGLPLALEQAAAYINVHRLSFSDYSGLLEEQSREVLEWFDSRLMTYPRSVAETWQPTFARLGVSARAMLHLLAFLDAEEIPRSLFEGAKAEPVLKEASDALGSEGKEEEFSLQEAVRELDSYSFLEVDGEGFSIHRMVQAVVRSRLREGEVDEWVGRGISLLLAAHPGNPTDARYWPQWERLRLHATSVIHHARSFGFAEPKLATLMNNTGLYLTERVLFSEAESLYRHALSIDESSYGGDHPTVAIRLNNLAVLLQSTNRMSESEPLMRRALEIDESSYGADHPRVAVQLNNLAQLLQSTNRLSESEPLMRRALEIDESSYGGGHPRVAGQLNNLAQLLQSTNRLSESEPLMRRALEIDESNYGPDHPKVAIRLNNLAQLLQSTNRLSESEPLMRRALEIDESSYGADHPVVAVDLNNLAALLKATNRLSESEPLMRRALEIDESSYGVDHPEVAVDLNNLAMLLQDTNRLGEAIPLMERSVAIKEKALVEGHPSLERGRANLAAMLEKRDGLEESS